MNRLTVKGAAALGLIVLGAVAHMGSSPKAASVERYSYQPGQLICDVGQGPRWGEMQLMVKNLR